MTIWADVSHYQQVPIDDSYPHRIFCFRTNSGSTRDNLALENARRARTMLDAGRLDAVLPYYFFRPGQANCDLHKEILIEAGIWLHPRTATMVDVEDAAGQIRGDHSAEINDEVSRLQGWYGNPRRVIGYLNAIANPGLWAQRPAGMRFVTPSYSHRPGVWASTAPPQWMRDIAFAQQYTDRGQCAPWPEGVDLNHSTLELGEILVLLGIEGGNTVADPIAEGAGQLRPFESKLRQIKNPKNVNSSTRSPEEPWPYDMWADLWNEQVWDGFELPAESTDGPKSAVGWALDTAVLLRRIEKQNARIIELLEGGAK